MIFEITCLHNDEYSRLKPRVPDSTYRVTIEANSKTEAVMKLHQEKGMIFEQKHKAILPIVWEICEKDK